MAIETAPLPLPPSADASKFTDFGREVIGVNPGQLSPEQFAEIEKLLYQVRGRKSSSMRAVLTYACQHSALLFRNADLTPEQQYALTKVRYTSAYR